VTSGIGPNSERPDDVERPASALERLLEVEAAAAEEVERARSRAAQIEAASRTRALRLEERWSRELAGAEADLARNVESWRAREESNIRSEADVTVSRYESADETKIRRLAAAVLDALLDRSEDSS